MKFLGPPSSGSIAGTTFSHNRAGQYQRNRRAPVQPTGTGRRAFIRASLSAASSAWSGITSAERAAWTSFANAYPITDSLGQTITLTGQQMFVRCNTSLQNVGQGIENDPPTTNVVPDVSTTNLTVSHTTGLTVDSFTGTAGDFVSVAFSPPLPPGRSFNKTFWQPLGPDGFADAASAPKVVAAAVYNAQFGTLTVGQRIFARVTPVNQFGFNGAPIIVSAIVT